MTMDHKGDTFFESLLDDYFAECEEHLARIRSHLLHLEARPQMERFDRGLFEELLRSFHTIKGLSGMVGLKEAEELSHEVEHFVRLLIKHRTPLTSGRMDALVAGARTLEQVIGAFHRRQGMPEIAPVAEALRTLGDDGGEAETKPTPPRAPSLDTPDAPSLALTEDERERLEGLLQGGARVFRVTFTPDPALARKGINVNVVRAELQRLGTVVHAAPQVSPSGGISFAFLVAGDCREENFLSLAEGAVECVPCDLATLLPAHPVPDSESPRTPADNGLAAGPSPPGPAGGSPFSSLTTANVVRVDLGKLDELMRLVGELVISRARLEEGLKRLDSTLPSAQRHGLQQINIAMERQLRDLREGVMRVRMVPVGEVFERMRFVVRDLARELQCQVELEIHGAETEIDKFIVERMIDPLLHLVRNAVSHGYESDEERAARGKPRTRRVTLSAATAGDSVRIEVADDGRGIDRTAVLKRARSLGLVEEDQVLDDSELLRCISHPGFSTRDQADLTSGRGVGMTVVANTIQELGGTLELSSQPGSGTRFLIHLPLTLAILDALIVGVADQVFAIPLSTVREVVEVRRETVTVLENNEIIPYRQGVLPLARLARVFNLREEAGGRWFALVVGEENRFLGLLVDRIVGQREIVVRALADPLIQVSGFAGATELGDGRVVLILDAGAISLSMRRRLCIRDPKESDHGQ